MALSYYIKGMSHEYVFKQNVFQAILQAKVYI